MAVEQQAVDRMAMPSECILSEREWCREAAFGVYCKVDEFGPEVDVGHASLVLPYWVVGHAARALHEVERDTWSAVGHGSDADDIETGFVRRVLGPSFAVTGLMFAEPRAQRLDPLREFGGLRFAPAGPVHLPVREGLRD